MKKMKMSMDDRDIFLHLSMDDNDPDPRVVCVGDVHDETDRIAPHGPSTAGN